MAKKISYSELFEPNWLDQPLKDLKELLKIVTDIELKFKDLIKTTAQTSKSAPKNYAEMKEAAENINKAKQAVDGLTAVEKEKIKLQEKLIYLESEEAKEIAKLKQKIQEKNKALKDEIKSESDSIGAYEKKSRRLNELRKKYKDAVAAGDGMKASTKALGKEVKMLDKEIKAIDESVGQHQRNVGNYSDALSGLHGPLGRAASGFNMLGGVLKSLLLNPVLLTITGIAAALGGIYSAMMKTDEGATFLAGTMRAFRGILDEVTGSFLKFGKTMLDVSDGSKSWFKEMGDFFSDELAVRVKSFTVFWESFKSILNTDFLEGSNKMTDALIQLILGIENAGEKTLDFIRKTKEYINLEKEFDALMDKKREDSIIMAENEVQINRLIQASKNRSKADSERIAMLEEADRLEKQNYEISVNNAKEYLRLIQKENEITIRNMRLKEVNASLSDEDLQKEVDAKLAILELDKQSLSLQEKLANRRDALMLEIYEDRKKNERQFIEEEKNKQKSIEQTNVQIVKGVKSMQQLNKEQEDIIAKQKKEREDRQKDIADSIELLGVAFEKQNQKRQDNIDKEIEQNRNRIEILQEIAAKGSEDAINNLAFEQKREAELKLRKEREERRAQRLKLATTAVETYSNKVANGESGTKALGSTIRDITLLREFIANLPAFYDGTEDTGSGGDIDKKGGFLSVIHPHERVIDAKTNSQLNGLSNEQLATIVKEKRKQPDTFIMYNSAIISKLDEMKQTIKEQPVYLGRDYNATEMAIIDTIKKNNRIEKLHKKTGGIW